ncbi:hypothetical protein KC678_05860, partial [Candidatus Dojkabacteria bacterium]|nr:hypothetical protein [Candidatus Dojkabacteria bacterium]
NTEVRVLASIITFNDNVLRPRTPYADKGREQILEELGIQNSAYSNVLKSLSKKGLLVKLAQKGDYALSTNVKKLKEYVDSNPKVSIANYYNIIDASDIRRSSEETEVESV